MDSQKKKKTKKKTIPFSPQKKKPKKKKKKKKKKEGNSLDVQAHQDAVTVTCKRQLRPRWMNRMQR